MGALELSNLYLEFEKRFGDLVRIYGISPNDESLQEFRELNIFRYPIFIPKFPERLKSIFKFHSPGLLKCFGFCNKNIINRFQTANSLRLGYNFKGKLSALGGVFIISNKGKIFYSYRDKFLGDSNYLDGIRRTIEEILGLRFPLGKKPPTSILTKYNLTLKTTNQVISVSDKDSNENNLNASRLKMGEILQVVDPDKYFELSSINASELRGNTII